MRNESEFIGTTEASRLLRLTGRRVGDLCREGVLPGAFKSGRNWRIPRDSVRDYMERAGSTHRQRQTAGTEAISGWHSPIMSRLSAMSMFWTRQSSSKSLG